MKTPQRLRPIDLRGDMELRGSSGCINVIASGTTLTLDFENWDVLGRMAQPLLTGGSIRRASFSDAALAALETLGLQVALRVADREIARLPAPGDASITARFFGMRGVRIRTLDLLRTAYVALRHGRSPRAG